MRLVQSRFVTENVERLAAFYAGLFGVPVALNDYYVEVHAGPMSVGFSRRKYTEYRQDHGPEIVLDFLVDDVDAEYERIAALGVDWVMPPTNQPWGTRAMIFADPEGNLINVFSRSAVPAAPPASSR